MVNPILKPSNNFFIRSNDSLKMVILTFVLPFCSLKEKAETILDFLYLIAKTYWVTEKSEYH